MRIILLPSAALVATLLAGAAATAADMPVRSFVKASPLAAYNWGGFYAGVNGGYGVSSDPITETFTPASDGGLQPTIAPAGWLGGLQAGYNWQWNRLVLGVEGDIQATSLRDSICYDGCRPNATAKTTQSLPWFATTRARLGYAPGAMLFYLTGGAAFTTVKTSISTTLAPTTTSGDFNDSRVGWTVGGGVEAALAANWTAKVEYLYMGFGSTTHAIVEPLLGPAFPEIFSIPTRASVVRAGVNYHFNAPGSMAYASAMNAFASASPAYDWTGFYIGGNLGAAAGRNPTTLQGSGGVFDESTFSPRSLAGGLQVGFNVQRANWVLGVEGDIQFTNLNESDCFEFCLANQTIKVEQKMPWFATARGRVGYALGPTLFYGTGGVAFTKVNSSYLDYDHFTFASGNFSDNRTGWAAGGGIESALAGNWTAKAEYLYLDFGTLRHDDIPNIAWGGTEGFTAQLHEHVFRFGVNYRFGSFPTPN